MDTGHDVTWNDTGLTIDAGDGCNGGSQVGKSLLAYLKRWTSANNTTMDRSFDPTIPHSVDIQDAEGNIIHRWQHIPGATS